MQFVRFRKPRTEPRRCSSWPLIVSVGPLLVPDRSKNAKTSPARVAVVRPSFSSYDD